MSGPVLATNGTVGHMNVLGHMGAFPGRHTILSVLFCVKLWPAHARFHIIHATPAFPPFLLPSRNVRRRRRRRPRLRDRPKRVDSSHEVTTSKGLQTRRSSVRSLQLQFGNAVTRRVAHICQTESERYSAFLIY